MKAVYFRSDDSHDFLIPAELVTKFDSDLDLLQMAECGDDEELYYRLCSKFDDAYMQYMVEGNLKSIKFYMNEE